MNGKRFVGALAALLLFSRGAEADSVETVVFRALGREFRWTSRDVGASAHTRFRKTVGLSGPSGRASVDAETGILVRFQSGEHPEIATGAPRLSAGQAEKIAVAFLQRAGVSAAGAWVLTDNEYIDHGSGGREYLLQWSKFFHGVELPAFLSIGVDADSGEVRTYMLVDDPVVVPLQARLTAADAIRRAAKKAGYARFLVEDARPRIWYQPKYPGPQALFWEVQLRNPDARTLGESEAFVRVNALTGEVVSIAVPASTAPVASGGKGAKKEGSRAKRSPSLPKVDLKAAQKAGAPPTIFEAAKRKGN